MADVNCIAVRNEKYQAKQKEHKERSDDLFCSTSASEASKAFQRFLFD